MQKAMQKLIQYIGLDVHKETIAVSLAPASNTEVRRYGIKGQFNDNVLLTRSTVGIGEIKMRTWL
jgi:hypothetical protein